MTTSVAALLLLVIAASTCHAKHYTTGYPRYENITCFGAEIFHQSIDDDDEDDGWAEVDACVVSVITVAVVLAGLYGYAPYFPRETKVGQSQSGTKIKSHLPNKFSARDGPPHDFIRRRHDHLLHHQGQPQSQGEILQYLSHPPDIEDSPAPSSPTPLQRAGMLLQRRLGAAAAAMPAQVSRIINRIMRKGRQQH